MAAFHNSSKKAKALGKDRCGSSATKRGRTRKLQAVPGISWVMADPSLLLIMNVYVQVELIAAFRLLQGLPALNKTQNCPDFHNFNFGRGGHNSCCSGVPSAAAAWQRGGMN